MNTATRSQALPDFQASFFTLPSARQASLRDLSAGLERSLGQELPRLAELLDLPEPVLSQASLGLSLALRGAMPASVQGIPFPALLLTLHHALSGVLVRPYLQPPVCRLLRTTPGGLHRARLALGLLLTASRPAPASTPNRSLDA